jgi:hypothetical protein
MRIVRRAITCVSCLAAVLFVGVALLYVRSIWVADQVTHVAVLKEGQPALLRGYKARSYHGHLFFSRIECDDNSGIYGRSDLGWHVKIEPAARISFPHAHNAIERLGFVAGTEGGPPVNPWRQTYAHVPHWAALLFFGVLTMPLVMTVHRSIRAKRRAAAGQCIACGYDVRATPGRCPECGAATT